MASQEHVPLRNDHSRATSTAETPTVSTASSDSIAPGPGSLGAKFLKWIGNTTLDSIQELVIRRRLVVIKRVVRSRSHIFIEALSSGEVHEVDRIHEDLVELCSVHYPSSVRRKAARMALEIAYIVHSRQCENNITGPTWITAIQDPWSRWSMLLKLSNTMTFGPLDRNDGGFTKTAVDSMFTSKGTYKTDGTTETRRTIQVKSGNAWTDAVARRKLALIKWTVRKRPQVFTYTQGLQQLQEVDEIFANLAHMTRDRSPDIRRHAARLVLEIAVVVYGPSDILSPLTPMNNDEATTMPPTISTWDHLVNSSDVHNLLTIPPASSSFMSWLRKNRN